MSNSCYCDMTLLIAMVISDSRGDMKQLLSRYQKWQLPILITTVRWDRGGEIGEYSL